MRQLEMLVVVHVVQLLLLLVDTWLWLKEDLLSAMGVLIWLVREELGR